MVEERKQERVFYSWQDDTLRKDNRYFIEEALTRAIKTVNKEGLSLDELVIDRDTKGVPGAPLIAETILGKIKASALFVADVTIIGKADSGKPITNPNVMAEFGFALGSLTDDDLVLVINVAYGEIDDLPFDLRHRRVMPYRLPPNSDAEDETSKAARKEIARELQQDFEKALRAWLNKRNLNPVVPLLSAVEQLEDYLLDPGNVRRAVRLIETEIEKFSEGIKAISTSDIARNETPEGVFQLMQTYEKLASDILPVFVRACHDDDGSLTQALVSGLNALAHTQSLNHSLGQPHLYPALLLLYAGGVAAVAGKRFATVVALLRQVKIRTVNNPRGSSAARELTPHRVLDERIAKLLPPVKANYTPISTYFFSLLREPLARIIKVSWEYEESFFIFEYLFALASAAAHKDVWGAVAAPVGSYIWERNLLNPPYIFDVVDKELEIQRDSWPPFRTGIFDGSFDEFLVFKKQVDESIKKLITNHFPSVSL